MAAPTNPTRTTLVMEAFYKVGIDAPSSAQVTRAEDYLFNEVLSDIWLRAGETGNTRLKTLQNFAVDITIDGQSKYPFPSDFDEEITLTFLDGTITGTATAGAASTITIEDEPTEAEMVGKYILLTGGTGENGFRQCIAYNTTSLVATVDAAWDTNPSTDTTYRIINDITSLEEMNLKDAGGLGNNLSSSFDEGDPNYFTKATEGVSDYYILDHNPNASTYGLHLRYYVDLLKVDVVEGSTIMSKIMLNWWRLLTMGMAAEIALDEDDTKYQIFAMKYEQLLSQMLLKEMPHGGEWQGFSL